MIQRLLDLLAGPPERATALSTDDARLALAALLVRVARADDHYHADERAVILRVLAERFGLAPQAAEALLQEAEALEAQAPDTVRFTRVVKEAVPYEERFGVLEALWRVALADGGRDHEEDGFLRLVANLLGVNDRDSALARQEAARRR